MVTEVAVIGAGLSGLSAAYRLAQAGLRPRVFERYPAPGGLARVVRVGGERLESFYHHIFTTDSAYRRLAGAFCATGSWFSGLPTQQYGRGALTGTAAGVPLTATCRRPRASARPSRAG